MTTRMFRPYDPEELWLLPPSPRDWLPDDHLAYFLSDLVEELNLAPILATYGSVTRGTPPYSSAAAGEGVAVRLCRGDSGLAADCTEAGGGCGLSGARGEPAAGFPDPQ